MPDKLPCKECGALILPTTFEITGGVCMACKNGIRRNIEKSKQAAKKHSTKPDPSRNLWVSLVNKVHGPGGDFKKLSHAEKIYFCVGMLEGEVYNGGFDQFFVNDSGSYYADTIKALEEIGAPQSLELLKQAKEILFHDRPVPFDTEERRKALPNYPTGNKPDPQWSKKLDRLDALFTQESDELARKLKKYAKDMGLL